MTLKDLKVINKHPLGYLIVLKSKSIQDDISVEELNAITLLMDSVKQCIKNLERFMEEK